MAVVFVSHHVKDFDMWKPVFDRDEEVRTDAGMRSLSIYRGEEDPNEVSMLFEVDDLDRMNKMISSPEMKVKMKEAGVDSDFEIKIMDKVA